MRIPRNLLIRAALGATAAAALALAATGAWWLPHRAGALHAEAARLTADLTALGVRPEALAPSDVALPAVGTLPARAAAVVAAVRDHGVGDVRYELGAGTPRGTLTTQPLSLTFEGSFPVVGAVLADLGARAPAVTVTGVDLERADGGRVEVTLHVDLLGGPAAAAREGT